MNKSQENKLSMYLVIQKTCNDNNAAWTALTAFNTAYTAFNAKVNDIVNARQIQENKIKGIAENKFAKRIAMIEKAIQISAAITALASDLDDNDLKESVNYSESELKKCPDTICRDRCLLIYNKATALTSTITAYGITAANLTSLQTAINDYVAIIPKPRTAQSIRATATKNIATIIKGADKILKEKLDKIIRQLKITKPDFFLSYVSARKIINSGTRHDETDFSANSTAGGSSPTPVS